MEADVPRPIRASDIINTGDFAVTNLGGITKDFSFRFPSLEHIDFVERPEESRA